MREAIKLKGETGIWEMVIGLEIHAQVNCKSKLFSGSVNNNCKILCVDSNQKMIDEGKKKLINLKKRELLS